MSNTRIIKQRILGKQITLWNYATNDYILAQEYIDISTINFLFRHWQKWLTAAGLYHTLDVNNELYNKLTKAWENNKKTYKYKVEKMSNTRINKEYIDISMTEQKINGWSWQKWLTAAGLYHTLDVNNIELYNKLTKAWENGKNPYKYKVEENV